MSRRYMVATAAHWTAVTALALALTQLAPFTGLYATASDLVAAAGVGLVGLAAAPHKGAQQ
ncbi:hypothetical protein [Streptomyces caniscabiei]|uniref:hypothetical protein n=1 Tax=Streptomyces caniscabiei TaxID=2746961 RepID=UPI000766155A|nr:hypothetical protein [Streptomyces caniscabiei]